MGLPAPGSTEQAAASHTGDIQYTRPGTLSTCLTYRISAPSWSRIVSATSCGHWGMLGEFSGMKVSRNLWWLDHPASPSYEITSPHSRMVTSITVSIVLPTRFRKNKGSEC